MPYQLTPNLENLVKANVPQGKRMRQRKTGEKVKFEEEFTSFRIMHCHTVKILLLNNRIKLNLLHFVTGALSHAS